MPSVRATSRPRRQLRLNPRPAIGVPRVYAYPVGVSVVALRCPFCDDVHWHGTAERSVRLALCSPAETYELVLCDAGSTPDSIRKATT